MEIEVSEAWLADFFRSQARLGFDEGDYTRTRNSCEQVLRLLPKDVECWSVLGKAALACQDAANAVHCFKRLVTLEPKTAEHHLELGKSYIQLQLWREAAASLRKALELDPANAQLASTLAGVERMAEALVALGQVPSTSAGRNDPCPCGSGKKYKHCCMVRAGAASAAQPLHARLREAEAVGQWQQVLSLAGEITDSTPDIRRAMAMAHFELGHRRRAMQDMQRLVGQFPKDAELLSAFADLLLDSEAIDKAQDYAKQALRLAPGHWRALIVLSACAARGGSSAQAESYLRQVVQHNPDCRMGWERLGELLRGSGREPESVVLLEEWARLRPQSMEAWFSLGYLHVLCGSMKQAMPAFEKAYQIQPEHHEPLCWLGACYRSEGNLDKAQAFILRGLQVKPDYGAGWNLLGGLYLSIGQQREAEGCLMRAVAIDPERPFPWSNLGNTYLDALELDEAENAMRMAVSLGQNDGAIWSNLGNVLASRQRLSQALEAYEKAVELAPHLAGVRANYLRLLPQFQRFDETIEQLRKEVGHEETALSNLLFNVNYHPDWPIERIYEVYREVITEHFPERLYHWYANDRQPGRRLRIGYLSPDFRGHACSMFIEPLMAHHRHLDFEIFAYSEVHLEDELTERFKGFADHWFRTLGVADTRLAEKIRDDGIDILVDLAGHTSSNRLKLFALKPAPIQVTWLGFGYTTGLSTIDYYLCDEELVPNGFEHVFSEKPWRIRSASFAYKPPADVPAVTPLPARSKGFVTFGTLTRPVRLNHRVIRVWAEILKRVPDSKLVINSGPFLDPGVCDFYASEFARHGVARERLDMAFTTPAWPVLGGMDIALDCFPHNSGTTLFESLWMGLPYITLRDRPSMGRLGATILRGLGRAEWIADSEAQYIDKAVALASDLDALEQIRVGLRPAMQASPLCDGADFTARVEEAYRGMWQRYWEQGEQ